MTGSVMGRTRDIAAAGAVAAIAVAIAWLYYTGLYCSDDTRYLLGAIRIAVGEDISTASLAERRVALLIPAAAMYAATRSIDWAIAIYPLFYVGLGIMAYALARLFFPFAGALLAALPALAQLALFLYSGALMPDLGSAFFIALALYLLCRMILDDNRRRQVAFASGHGCMVGHRRVLGVAGVLFHPGECVFGRIRAARHPAALLRAVRGAGRTARGSSVCFGGRRRAGRMAARGRPARPGRRRGCCSPAPGRSWISAG
ncbi:hypothetical protein BGP89_00665 [Luteimonas sp. JM171]|uniref:hypothetical protein n=1 Tax=Luteimonas sp. JM171 TaxID=1896164 RepID=UPI000858BC44|nr:hypothetical protein [Luteimonas sp. JM171]AOH35058.1 hypothetical protein BGP89_00665 [Luteimonas sp. JM171]